MRSVIAASVIAMSGSGRLRSHTRATASGTKKVLSRLSTTKKTLGDVKNVVSGDGINDPLLNIVTQSVQTASEIEAEARIQQLAQMPARPLQVLENVR